MKQTDLLEELNNVIHALNDCGEHAAIVQFSDNTNEYKLLKSKLKKASDHLTTYRKEVKEIGTQINLRRIAKRESA